MPKFFEGQPQLSSPFLLTKVKEATFNLNSYKAPGPDCIQAYFSGYGWTLIQKSLIHFANHVLSTLDDIKNVNQIFNSLISKKEVVEKVADFRPINLCNTSYKVISKLIVHQIKPFCRIILAPISPVLFLEEV